MTTQLTLPASPEASLDDWRRMALAFEEAIGTAVIGQERAIRLATLAVFCRGHVLLEGDVGVGKTTLLRAIAQAIGGPYERIEGTIDLMPTDVVYAAYLGEDGRPRVDPGPILRHGSDLAVFFFNEINRARPQVHALLLRAMAERSLTAFQRERCLAFNFSASMPFPISRSLPTATGSNARRPLNCPRPPGTGSSWKSTSPRPPIPTSAAG